jgi:hypothetical protein
MMKMNEIRAKDFVAELAAKCDKRWKETVDKTRFMDEMRQGKLKKETIQLLQKLGIFRAGDQLGLHLGLLQTPVVCRKKRRPDGSLHAKSPR